VEYASEERETISLQELKDIMNPEARPKEKKPKQKKKKGKERAKGGEKPSEEQRKNPGN